MIINGFPQDIQRHMGVYSIFSRTREILNKDFLLKPSI